MLCLLFCRFVDWSTFLYKAIMYFVRVACFLCNMLSSFVWPLYCMFLLRFTASDYPSGNFNLFLHVYTVFVHYMSSCIIASLLPSYINYHIGGVMVSVLAVDRWVDPRSDQTKNYEIGICCFSAKHAALRSKSKDWSARNQNNVS